MKELITALMLLLSLEAFSQLDQQRLRYAQKAERFRRMNTIGTVMIVGGAGLAIYGGIHYAELIKTSSNGGTVSQGAAYGATYALIGGIYLLGGGIPLKIIGGRKMRQYEEKLQTTSLHLEPSRNSVGVALTWRFH